MKTSMIFVFVLLCLFYLGGCNDNPTEVLNEREQIILDKEYSNFQIVLKNIVLEYHIESSSYGRGNDGSSDYKIYLNQNIDMNYSPETNEISYNKNDKILQFHFNFIENNPRISSGKDQLLYVRFNPNFLTIDTLKAAFWYSNNYSESLSGRKSNTFDSKVIYLHSIPLTFDKDNNIELSIAGNEISNYYVQAANNTLDYNFSGLTGGGITTSYKQTATGNYIITDSTMISVKIW